MHQQVILTGVVKDMKEQVLPGVIVVLKGTTLGTATDMEGRFKLSLPKLDKPVMVFSFIGMKRLEIAVEPDKPLEIVLEGEAASLNEVVITGYQTIDKRKNTGALNLYRWMILKFLVFKG